MKKVFNSASEVMHVFAQRMQKEASSSNCYIRKSYNFTKDYANEIYSYGSHYLLAEFVPNPLNQYKELVYINDGGYSHTTSKHIRQITAASRHLTQIFRSHTIKPVLSDIQEAFKD